MTEKSLHIIAPGIYLKIIVLLVCHSISTNSFTMMTTHNYFTEMFINDPVSTEYNAYIVLTNMPIPKNINYLAIPWAVLINTKQLNKIPDIKLNGGFTICQHIQYEKILPTLRKIGIDTLFTPHVKKGKKYDGITILPFPHYAVNGTEPAQIKDLLYSFVGASFTHPTRAAILNMHIPANAIVKERKDWHWYNTKEQQEKERTEYQDLLARSRFSLCPRGTGPSTIRFWESLQAGAIPVLIADDMDLPKDINWNECIIQIPEKDVLSINDVLKTISPEKEKVMRIKCLEAYQLFSKENFVSTIRKYYNS